MEEAQREGLRKRRNPFLFWRPRVDTEVDGTTSIIVSGIKEEGGQAVRYRKIAGRN